MATATKNKFLPLKQQLHFYYTFVSPALDLLLAPNLCLKLDIICKAQITHTHRVKL